MKRSHRAKRSTPTPIIKYLTATLLRRRYKKTTRVHAPSFPELLIRVPSRGFSQPLATARALPAIRATLRLNLSDVASKVRGSPLPANARPVGQRRVRDETPFPDWVQSGRGDLTDRSTHHLRRALPVRPFRWMKTRILEHGPRNRGPAPSQPQHQCGQTHTTGYSGDHYNRAY
jgi:hypothetical protein